MGWTKKKRNEIGMDQMIKIKTKTKIKTLSRELEIKIKKTTDKKKTMN